MTILRSMLFVPGNNARRVDKALGLDADAVILDLEDAVAAAEKPAARAALAAALSRPRKCLAYVRINALETEWCYRDLVAVVQPGLDGIVLPKAESASDVRTIDWLMRSLERERGMPLGSVDLIPIIETGKGVARIDAICASRTRVKRVVFGAADYTLDMNMQWTREETELAPARAAIVLASRVAGIEPPIDTVWARLQDLDGLRASVRTSLVMGFQGRMCIHPDQLAVVHEVFTPSAEEHARALKVVAAFEEAERGGLASIRVDGQFVDYPIVEKARRVVALMRRIETRG
ncbi:MAG: CoA ester lyase [Burkholderiales bacterium]|nr:CoA ester lyase [Burkholderiales bacterium]